MFHNNLLCCLLLDEQGGSIRFSFWGLMLMDPVGEQSDKVGQTGSCASCNSLSFRAPLIYFICSHFVSCGLPFLVSYLFA
ncbi:hypothetical protein VNO78_18480 [Psophocarpus tetragonolobus]|uniref:Uncharacterized protein n=1 Tax=Psophocarpus tetragonolobus TaxID=3891 RepID=A0AAN9SJJ1_PSOTE